MPATCLLTRPLCALTFRCTQANSNANRDRGAIVPSKVLHYHYFHISLFSSSAAAEAPHYPQRKPYRFEPSRTLSPLFTTGLTNSCGFFFSCRNSNSSVVSWAMNADFVFQHCIFCQCFLLCTNWALHLKHQQMLWLWIELWQQVLTFVCRENQAVTTSSIF